MISPEKLEELQENLIRSHASGVGRPLTPDKTRFGEAKYDVSTISTFFSRMLLALRINVLSKGYSGIAPGTLQQLVDAFNGRIFLLLFSNNNSRSSSNKSSSSSNYNSNYKNRISSSITSITVLTVGKKVPHHTSSRNSQNIHFAVIEGQPKMIDISLPAFPPSFQPLAYPGSPSRAPLAPLATWPRSPTWPWG